MSTFPVVNFVHDLFAVHTSAVFGEGEDDDQTIREWEREYQGYIDEIGQALLPVMLKAQKSEWIVSLDDHHNVWSGKGQIEVVPVNCTLEIRPTINDVGTVFIRFTLNTTSREAYDELCGQIDDAIAIKK